MTRVVSQRNPLLCNNNITRPSLGSFGGPRLRCCFPQPATASSSHNNRWMVIRTFFANDDAGGPFFSNQDEVDRFFATKEKLGTKKKEKIRKKKEKDKKVIPPLPSMEEARAQMEGRFAEIEKEKFGPHRGRGTVKFLVGKKGEKLHKTVTTKMSHTILNDWVYTRHALKHGYRHINEMNTKSLAASLIRDGTTVKFEKGDARKALKEMFRYGRSSMLDRYIAIDKDRVATIKEEQENGREKLARRKEMEEAGYTEEQMEKAEKDRIKAKWLAKKVAKHRPNDDDDDDAV